MTKKQYSLCITLTAIILGVIIAFSTAAGNYHAPALAILAAVIFIAVCKKKVNFILADERDVRIRQKSSRWAVTVHALASVLLAIIFFSLTRVNRDYYLLAQTLAYSACFLIFLDASFYWYLNKRGE